MDFTVGLSTTIQGHDSIWVVVDRLTRIRLTRMCKFIPTKSIVKTPKLAMLCVDQLYQFYDLPSNIVSDHDQKFNSHFGGPFFID